MAYGGCAGSLRPTRLSLQFGKLQGDLAKLQGQSLHISAEDPLHLSGLVRFLPNSRSRETKILSREGRIGITVPDFFEINSRVIHGHPIAKERCLLHPQERTCSASEPMSTRCHTPTCSMPGHSLWTFQASLFQPKRTLATAETMQIKLKMSAKTGKAEGKKQNAAKNAMVSEPSAIPPR
jgi:hypothetical protein